jgi:hypothetical protein
LQAIKQKIVDIQGWGSQAERFLNEKRIINKNKYCHKNKLSLVLILTSLPFPSEYVIENEVSFAPPYMWFHR